MYDNITYILMYYIVTIIIKQILLLLIRNEKLDGSQ